MPGYMIHFAVASIAAQRLYPHDKQKRNLFCCGALFPDAFEDEQKNASHYYTFSDKDCVFRSCDLSFFTDSHLQFGTNAFLCGYYVHLLTDQLFYHSYLPQIITIYDGNWSPCQDGIMAEWVWLKSTGELIPYYSFFDNLYNDYTKTTQIIKDRYGITVPVSFDNTYPQCFPGCPDTRTCQNNMKELLDMFNDLLKNPDPDDKEPSVLNLSSLFCWISSTAECVAEYIRSENSEGQSSKGWDIPAVLPVWSQKWLQTASQCPSSENIFFYRYFLALYSTIRAKADDYQQKNFKKKGRFIFVAGSLCCLNALMVFIYLFVCYRSSAYHLDGTFLLAAEVAFLLFSLLMLFPITKSIDIHKYQETWARHRLQAERIEIEMMKFISELPPYDKEQPANNCKQFIGSILKTEKQTAELFTHLMTSQEKPLLEELIKLSNLTES